MQTQDNINILILSAGTRNKVVQAFRQALAGKGKVVATDASALAPALYDADKAYVVPGSRHRIILTGSWKSAGRRTSAERFP